MWIIRGMMLIGLLSALSMVLIGGWLLSLGNQSLVYSDSVHLFVSIFMIFIGCLSTFAFVAAFIVGEK